MKPEITLFTGGCRSGKSRLALQHAESFAAARHVFVATCRPQDDEMRLRVARHQSERGSHWQTMEAPLSLPSAIAESSGSDTVVLADCLTLWVSNVLLQQEDPRDVHRAVRELETRLTQIQGPVILVTNEVGAGIVPGNRLARSYRDEVGLVNQTVARMARHVIWSVAGIPVAVKADGVPTRPLRQ